MGPAGGIPAVQALVEGSPVKSVGEGAVVGPATDQGRMP